jgi:hypothetical protein
MPTVEIQITPTHFTVWDDKHYFAIWPLAALDAAKLWTIVEAVRGDRRDVVEALAKGDTECS